VVATIMTTHLAPGGKTGPTVARFTTSITISRERGLVYREYLDPANFPRWVRNWLRMETLVGEPDGAGGRNLVYFAGRRGEVVAEERIVSAEPGRRYVYVMLSPYTVSTVQVDFEEEGTGTRIRWDNEVRGRNVFWSLLLPAIVPRIKANIERDLSTLKRVIESKV
jgi:uncharacterized protein YndB with AHSA1/START domain